MSESKEKVPVSSKFWLSIADAMTGTLNSLVTGGGLTYYFTKYLGMDVGMASLVWIIFGIWNAVNDPLFGYISDRTKSKLGRRIPYIRYGAAFYAIVFIFTWVKWPIGQSQTALFLQMLISLFLFDTLYTAIATSLYVMPYAMALTDEARSGIFLFKIIFSVFSLAAPLVIFPMIKPDPGEDPTRFQIIMTAIGILAFAIIFISTFFYKEKIQTQEENSGSIWKNLVQCLKNRSFLCFEVISWTVIFIQTILMQGVNYYFDEFSVPMALCYGFLALGVICGIVLFIRKLTDWGVRKCTVVMCVIFMIGCLLMTFLGGNAVVAAISFFTVGIGFAGGMYLVPIMNGDVIDYDETISGERREGMYAGTNSLITKPAISLANSAFISIAAAFGYDNTLSAGMQSAGAKAGILVAWMAVPAALLFLSALSMKWYPLHGEKWQKAKAELARKHAAE